MKNNRAKLITLDWMLKKYWFIWMIKKLYIYVIRKIFSWVVLFVVFMYLYVSWKLKRLINKKIILITERWNTAWDNGIHLFRYLRSNYPDLPVYYIISSDSSELDKVKELWNIVFTLSFKYYAYFLSCSFFCATHWWIVEPISIKLYNKLYGKIIWRKMIYIFLQHWVIKDDLSTLYHKEIIWADYFVTSWNLERNSIIATYWYSQEEVILTGISRFDSLYVKRWDLSKSGKILFMPTRRSYLLSKTKFYWSNYYKWIINVLNSEIIAEILSRYNYVIDFQPHKEFINWFWDIEHKYISNRNNAYIQDLILESDILITDYSSVFFDFAYQKKPIIHYCYDHEEFIKSHYNLWYFDIENDWFWEYTTTLTQLCKSLESTLKRKSLVEQKYDTRVNNFFAFIDSNNSKRLADFIIQLRA